MHEYAVGLILVGVVVLLVSTLVPNKFSLVESSKSINRKVSTKSYDTKSIPVPVAASDSVWKIVMMTEDSVVGMSNAKLVEAWQRIYPANEATDRIRYVLESDLVEVDDRTVAVVINRCDPRRLDRFVNSRILGLSHEPMAFFPLDAELVNFANQRFHRYIVSDLSAGNRLQSPPFVQGYQFLMHLTEDPSRVLSWADKPNLISIMVSEKHSLPGHQYRHRLCDEIVRLDLPVDIWGGGANKYAGRRQCKGGFERAEPYHGYKFHIAIENTREAEYVSEKFTNCLVFNTIPVYLGCPNIERHFGPNCVVILTGDLAKDISTIRHLCQTANAKGSGGFYRDTSSAARILQSGSASFTQFLKNDFLSSLPSLH